MVRLHSWTPAAAPELCLQSTHTAEDGDGDGEGVQRAGGAFPDRHWRHEGKTKKKKGFIASPDCWIQPPPFFFFLNLNLCCV